MIRILAVDIDGVLTDGKIYISNDMEFKTICYQDLDTFSDIRKDGTMIAIITGENNGFTEFIREKINPDFFYPACKNKGDAILDIMHKIGADKEQICYIGDGKYDISAMEIAGISICPGNAIDEVKKISDIVLSRNGGEGCLAEAYSFFKKKTYCTMNELIRERVFEHNQLIRQILHNQFFIESLINISGKIVECYQNGGKLLLCGNGGSAADAQHIAAELVSRFYMEREPLSAEALSTNTSIITAIGNDYDFSQVFKRGVEAQGKKGDILIGISTSGKSENIINAFAAAKNLGIITVLFTGMPDEITEILDYTDYVLNVPSKIVPRIQEIHILSGHILCELIESKIFGSEKIKYE